MPYASGYDPNQGGAGTNSQATTWADYQKEVADGYGNTGVDSAEAFLGGPVGWYEAATGKSLLGNGMLSGIDSPFSRTTADKSMTEDVYNSMSADDWKRFSRMSGAEKAAFVQSRTKDLGTYSTQKSVADKAAAEQAAKQAQYDAWRQDQMTRLSDFAKEMGMSVDELVKRGDAGALASRAGATIAAGHAAYSAGLGTGGISEMNTQRAQSDALLGYQMQRKQLGLQATTALGQQINQNYMSDEDRRRYEQGMNMQLQGLQAQQYQQQYAQNMQQAGGTLGMIGGVIGGIYGGGAAGASAGYQLGSGFGQSQYQQNHPYQSYQYQYPSGSGGGGGGGGLGSKYPYYGQ